MSAPEPATIPLDTPLEAFQKALEAAWENRPAGVPPRWQEFLPYPGQPCPAEFVFLLLQTDIEMRVKAGLAALLAEPYFQDPRLQAAGLAPARQAELIRWEYQQRWKRGDRAERRAYLERFAELADLLQDLKPRWNCPSCKRQAIPLENESAQEAVCPWCDAVHSISRLFPLTSMLPSLPGYDILEELGRGGMGVVCKARQRALNRLVALKQILPAVAGRAGFLERFQNEAQALARLEHPHVVRIYDQPIHQGQPFLVLEYCPGGALADRLKRDGPWSPERAAALVEALAEAVAYAHRQGFLHRDLKPANVLFDVHDLPRLSDFGLACCQEMAGQLTGSHDLLGSPAYMAPEQADRRLGALDERTDVFGLGAILYQLLTGEPPYREATREQTLERARQGAVKPVHDRNHAVPAGLERICLKALAA